MQDPLQQLLNTNKIDTSSIQEIVCGEKYAAILLKNGNIGVCATLSNQVNINIKDFKNPDLENIQHRIVCNAYFNALLNYENSYEKIIDIFDHLDFKKYSNIVMVGYFHSLIKKFEKDNIPLSFFDKAIENEELSPMSELYSSCSKADAIILTGTTIFNGSFQNIVNSSGKNCDIFLLGPSNILHQDMLKYKNIKIIFGALFENNDTRILKLVKEGHGTKSFLPYMKKVYLIN